MLERASEAKLLKERIVALKEIEPDAYKGKTDEIVARMMKVSSSYVRQLVRVDNADSEVKGLLSDEVIGISEALRLQAMDAVQKEEVADKIRNAAGDEVADIMKVEVVAKKHSTKSVGDVINSDLLKINKLVKNYQKH